MTTQGGLILVVEDIPNILELLDITLRFKGYQVATATNGQEGLERIQAEKPALIITDILMPKMDGYAMAYQVRQDPSTRDIPIIFLSATYTSPEDKEFAMSLGAVRFLEKPIDTEDFLLSVAEVMLRQHPPTRYQPLSQEQFYTGYRARLESKLRHKNKQINRIERLLGSLPQSQKTAFSSLLDQAAGDRNAIQAELEQVYRTMLDLNINAGMTN
jgi:CheY-like chemotaxis protein